MTSTEIALLSRSGKIHHQQRARTPGARVGTPKGLFVHRPSLDLGRLAKLRAEGRG
jgi:hypothetical protein